MSNYKIPLQENVLDASAERIHWTDESPNDFGKNH